MVIVSSRSAAVLEHPDEAGLDAKQVWWRTGEDGFDSPPDPNLSLLKFIHIREAESG
jgi:hypothetical protein